MAWVYILLIAGFALANFRISQLRDEVNDHDKYVHGKLQEMHNELADISHRIRWGGDVKH